MATIEFSRGIERILPNFDPQQEIHLPERSNITPEGERVTNYLEVHFSSVLLTDELLDFIRPKLYQNTTAPWFYIKSFRKILAKWKKTKVESAADQEILNQGISVLDIIESDMDLLSDYLLCLQKV